MQAGRVCINEEWVTLAEDGSHILLETRKVPVYDEARRIYGVLGIARDITEHRLRDEQMAFLDYALDRVSDALYLIDAQARFVEVNEAACRMLGYTREELCGISIFDIDPDFGPEQWAEYWVQSKTGKTKTSIDTRHRRKNGELFEVEVSANFITYQEREYDLALVRDVSARKAAETLLRRREAELRTLVQNLSTCIVRLDRNCRITFLNPAYLASLAAEESRVLGAHVSEFWHAQNMTAGEYVEILQRVMATGHVEDVMLEWNGLSGDFYNHLVRVAPEYTPEGTIQGVVALGFDITERRRQEMIEQQRQQVLELMAENASLDAVLRRIEQFVSSSKPGSTCCIRMASHAPTDEISVILYAAHQMKDMAASNAATCCPDPTITGFGCSERSRPEACLSWQHQWSEPVKSATGDLLGAVTLSHEQSSALSDIDLAVLKQAAQLVAIALERKRIEERMEQQASFDALTGLPNRRLFGSRLHEDVSKAERNHSQVALLFIDLDRFKEVNDTLGHDIGDRLLIESANRIRQCVRISDMVARLGGDEFVVTIAEYAETVQIARLSQQIVDALSQPFQFENQVAYVSASIGIACYPDDADNLNTLVSRADQAMYAAKAQGRNGYCFFTPFIQEQALYRMRIANDLRMALQENQLAVHYQPIVDAASGQVVKAEALLRWHHPTLGDIRPDIFIPLAEENGTIYDIGDWVFQQAAALTQRWKDRRQSRGRGALACQVSVNISPRQFSRGQVETAWINHLQAIGLEPASMVVEITEGLLLDDRSGMTERLRRIREAGIQVALDDFGTGYSAMSYLKKFSLDYLKIDRSFVRDLALNLNDRAIAEAIIVMAHKLGLRTIAEGVETTEQRELLKAAGCEFIQGYLYAKPLPEEDFLALVDALDRAAPVRPADTNEQQE
jgi:diguanylate cyclase (GGDEF)-like protein/PAS domain S-box-containing protein